MSDGLRDAMNDGLRVAVDDMVQTSHALLRSLAIAAIPGYPLDAADSTGQWEAWFNFHGDPYVVESGRGQFGTVATVATVPEDYGRARAEFMGAANPATVLALLDELVAARNALMSYQPEGQTP